MFHPLLRLLASRPELLADHLAGYAELVSAQAFEARANLKRRAALLTGAVVMGALGIGLAGVALLLVGVVPIDDMPAPWLLLAGPALPLIAAALCWQAAKSAPGAWSMTPLREQWAADVDLLRDAGAGRKSR